MKEPTYLAYQLVMRMRDTPAWTAEAVLVDSHDEDYDETEGLGPAKVDLTRGEFASNLKKLGSGVTFTDFVQTLDLEVFDEEVCLCTYMHAYVHHTCVCMLDMYEVCAGLDFLQMLDANNRCDIPG